jgi:hypothetical protein
MLSLATSAFGASAAPNATAATPSAGSVGIRLLDVPVNADNDPRARLYIVDHLAPGAVIHRRIEVSNTTSSPVRVALYAAAAAIAGESFIGDQAHTANDLSTWTSVIPSAPEVPSRGSVTATVTIAVPANAVSGEQYAVVWAEVGTVAATGSGVTEVNRVGIRVYLSVGGGAAPAANFAIDSLTAERSSQGHPVVVAAVHNVGGRALDMSGSLQLSSGPGELSAGPFPATLGVTLAIGDTEPVTITLNDAIPNGPWDALVTLHSGLTERSARATITFPSNRASAPVTTTPNRRTSSRALAVAIALASLAIGAAGVLLLRRRAGAPAARRHAL